MGVTDTTRAYQWHVKVRQLFIELHCAFTTSMTSGPVVHRDEAIRTTINTLFRPLAFRHIVIDQTTDRMDLFRYPVRLAQ